MAYVVVDDRGLEYALRKFKKKIEEEGLMKELRKREYYRSPSLKRAEKSKEAEKRRRLLEINQQRYTRNSED